MEKTQNPNMWSAYLVGSGETSATAVLYSSSRWFLTWRYAVGNGEWGGSLMTSSLKASKTAVNPSPSPGTIRVYHPWSTISTEGGRGWIGKEGSRLPRAG